MAKKIPTIPDNVQEYILCLIFHMLLPLLPLAIEYYQGGSISESTLLLTASLYALTMGVSSESKLLFGLSIIIGLVFAFSFGIAIGSNQSISHSSLYAKISIVSIFLVHAAERWNLHIVEEEPYFKF